MQTISYQQLAAVTGGQQMPGGPMPRYVYPIGTPTQGFDRAAASGEATAQRGGGGGGGSVPAQLPLLY